MSIAVVMMVVCLTLFIMLLVTEVSAWNGRYRPSSLLAVPKFESQAVMAGEFAHWGYYEEEPEETEARLRYIRAQKILRQAKAALAPYESTLTHEAADRFIAHLEPTMRVFLKRNQ